MTVFVVVAVRVAVAVAVVVFGDVRLARCMVVVMVSIGARRAVLPAIFRSFYVGHAGFLP
ncbi:hypothetical protein BN2475_370004 [Paraburkholderia ribeironis]|uniref:Uncharacterized protein n=1 Tax=Paraburkholderia ribeironis TaxID=1247936 RepID=A0A1N7S4S6_9BURK|nr:hypothetical protein BN2475_370004 [Paraburkholderia ribeironis]